MTVRVLTDSACDLPQALADDLGITIVPLTIRFGSVELTDRHDLSPSEFWTRYAAGAEPPETAAPSPSRFEAAYRALADAGATGVVVVCVSSLLSATLQSAQLAATGVGGVVAVRVVDSRSATTGLGMIVVAAARRARAGAGIDEVAALVDDLAARTHVWGVLDSVDNLRRAGRIGGPRALVASLLAVKPIIEVRDGLVEENGSRSRDKALAALVEKVRLAGPLEDLAVFHAETSDVDAFDRFVTQLAPLAPRPVMVTDVGAVIGSHCGPGAIGVAFQTEPAPSGRAPVA